MPALPNRITIGELAARSGMAASALRFYEEQGLISAERTAGNQRGSAPHPAPRVLHPGRPGGRADAG